MHNRKKKTHFERISQQELDNRVCIVSAISWTAEELWREFLQVQGIFLFQIVQTYAGAATTFLGCYVAFM